MHAALPRRWRELRARIKERWGELTGIALDWAHGRYGHTIGDLQGRETPRLAYVEARVFDFPNDGIDDARRA